MAVTNERKMIQRLKELSDKVDGLYAILKLKQEGTWVSGKYLIANFGITQNSLRTLRRAGLKSKGVGSGKKYLLESFPEQLIKRKEVADKATSQK
jgi:hypothetical protein